MCVEMVLFDYLMLGFDFDILGDFVVFCNCGVVFVGFVLLFEGIVYEIVVDFVNDFFEVCVSVVNVYLIVSFCLVWRFI